MAEVHLGAVSKLIIILKDKPFDEKNIMEVQT